MIIAHGQKGEKMSDLLEQAIEETVRKAILDWLNLYSDTTREWLHDLLQDAIEAGIITETQASRIMDRIAEDNT